ncbi:uncharacterized protein ALTATR162_LOCUS11116 [Alternaria atra]|uniref:Uncharacterized protein n=1 Tax=Alternaria atra TaxID=119953 RepID=A0A8J2IAP0_9PLEO|nr:uncharacterized protein ALTATR162_LOCUS11116 [Alternaria atra]CAG5184856.1 unnamed protein product [Alternaria atra]
MAKTKTLIISGPMNAKHVGGVNVLGNSSSNLDTYFPSTSIVPDERPSHTFVAIGRTEVPRRSDTVAGTLRRPSVSLTRSLSKLRRSSTSHHTELARGAGENQQVDSQIGKSDNASRPLRVQSSMSRLRQRVGLDRELYDTAPTSKTRTPEPQPIPELVRRDYLPLQDTRALARLTTTSSIYSTTDLDLPKTGITRKQQPVVVQRRPSPLERRPPTANAQTPARSKRADSGTAIDFANIPVQERPIPFKEIMATPTLAERMAMYKKTREYWAHADHGLIAWTERAAGPKVVTTGL